MTERGYLDRVAAMVREPPQMEQMTHIKIQ